MPRIRDFQETARIRAGVMDYLAHPTVLSSYDEVLFCIVKAGEIWPATTAGGASVFVERRRETVACCQQTTLASRRNRRTPRYAGRDASVYLGLTTSVIGGHLLHDGEYSRREEAFLASQASQRFPYHSMQLLEEAGIQGRVAISASTGNPGSCDTKPCRR